MQQLPAAGGRWFVPGLMLSPASCSALPFPGGRWDKLFWQAPVAPVPSPSSPFQGACGSVLMGSDCCLPRLQLRASFAASRRAENAARGGRWVLGKGPSPSLAAAAPAGPPLRQLWRLTSSVRAPVPTQELAARPFGAHPRPASLRVPALPPRRRQRFPIARCICFA